MTLNTLPSAQPPDPRLIRLGAGSVFCVFALFTIRNITGLEFTESFYCISRLDFSSLPSCIETWHALFKDAPGLSQTWLFHLFLTFTFHSTGIFFSILCFFLNMLTALLIIDLLKNRNFDWVVVQIIFLITILSSEAFFKYDSGILDSLLGILLFRSLESSLVSSRDAFNRGGWMSVFLISVIWTNAGRFEIGWIILLAFLTESILCKTPRRKTIFQCSIAFLLANLINPGVWRIFSIPFLHWSAFDPVTGFSASVASYLIIPSILCAVAAIIGFIEKKIACAIILFSCFLGVILSPGAAFRLLIIAFIPLIQVISDPLTSVIQKNATLRALYSGKTAILILFLSSLISFRILTNTHYTASNRPDRLRPGVSSHVIPIAACERLLQTPPPGCGFVDSRLKKTLLFVAHAQGDESRLLDWPAIEITNDAESSSGIFSSIPVRAEWFAYCHALHSAPPPRDWAVDWKLLYYDHLAAIFARRIPMFLDYPEVNFTMDLSPRDEWNLLIDVPVNGGFREQLAAWIWNRETPLSEKYGKSLFLISLNQFAAARHLLLETVLMSPSQHQIYEWLSLIYSQEGKWDEANRCDRMILMYKPWSKTARERSRSNEANYRKLLGFPSDAVSGRR